MRKGAAYQGQDMQEIVKVERLTIASGLDHHQIDVSHGQRRGQKLTVAGKLHHVRSTANKAELRYNPKHTKREREAGLEVGTKELLMRT